MVDTNLPTNPTPPGPFVPQGIQGLLSEAEQVGNATDLLLETLQGDPALDPSLVQLVKDARNSIRESSINRNGIRGNGRDDNDIP